MGVCSSVVAVSGVATVEWPVSAVTGREGSPEIAGVPRRALGDKIASLRHRREEIIATLDSLFTGI